MTNTFFDKNTAENRKEKIKVLLDDIRANGEVFIFGAGIYANRLQEFLSKKDITVKGYVVDDGYENRSYEAGPVFPLSEIISKGGVCLVYGLGGGYNRFYYEKTSAIRQAVSRSKDSVFYVMPGDYWMEQGGYLTHEVIDDAFLTAHFEEFEKTYSMLEDDYSKKVMSEYVYASVCGDATKLAELGTSPESDYDLDILFRNCQDGLVIECGAFDGTSIVQMSEYTGNKYNMIAFECDKDNYVKCIEKTKDYSNISVLKQGVWDKKTKLAFVQSSEASYIKEVSDEDAGDDIVEVTDVNSVIGDQKVAALIMDIEGSELRALKGADKAIRDGSNLAIRIYHKKEDLITIPQFIKNLNGTYKFYIRFNCGANLCRMGDETTLYAICD